MLDVVIIGAGISGLSAAIALRRSGHRVHIYERGSLTADGGAAITIPGNASRILNTWGLTEQELDGVHGSGLIHYDFKTLEISNALGFDHLDRKYGTTYWYGHRADLHCGLKRVAFAEDGAGVPVVAYEYSPVKSFDPDTPSVTLVNGQVITADAIVATDGVHSSAPSAITGRKVTPLPDPRFQMCYRFLISRDELASTPTTAFWLKQHVGSFSTVEDVENDTRMIVYPCRGGSLYNFVILFHLASPCVPACSTVSSTCPCPETDGLSGEGITGSYAKIDSEPVLQTLRNFHPVVHATVRMAKGIRRFPVLCQEPLPCWKRGKMVVAGDAAHAMMPLLGQGAAQAVEDGAVLGTALHGATRENIESRLEIFERLRRVRAAAIQIMSRVGIGCEEQGYEDWLKLMPDKDIPRNPLQSFEMSHGFDLLGQVTQEIARSESVAQ